MERRARMHAALGEPVRLGIADRLALGDASPGELADVLGLGTNLLAHHLGVLEEAGVIRRVRSTGDRRRTYVQLRADDAAVARLLQPPTVRRAPRVVFICTQNSARSQLAAAAWAGVSKVPVASAGTQPARRVHPRAVTTARRHGLHVDPVRTAHISDVLEPIDLVVTVCDAAHEELPAERSRLHWSVPDPAEDDTAEAFEAAYRSIAVRIGRLAGAISTEQPKQNRRRMT